MPDLTDAVLGRIDDFTPTGPAPDFARLHRRQVSRRRRQRGLAVLTIVALAGAGTATTIFATGKNTGSAQLANESITPYEVPADPDAAAAGLKDLLIRQVQSHTPGLITDSQSSHQTTVRADGPLLALQAMLRWQDGQGGIRLAATWTPRSSGLAPTSCDARTLAYAYDCRVLEAKDGGSTLLYSQDKAKGTRTAVRIFPDGSVVQLFASANEAPHPANVPPAITAQRADRPSLPFDDEQMVDIVAHLAITTDAAPTVDPDLALHQCMAAAGATVSYTALGWDASFPSAALTRRVRADCQDQLSRHP